MAREPITADMVREAGITASMATNPVLLPLRAIMDDEVSSEHKVFSLDSNELYGTHGRADDESANVNGIVTGNTAWRDRVALELEIADRNKNDATDIAMAEASATIEKNLEKIRTSYANGTYTIGGVDVDAEDLDDAVSNANDDFDDFAGRAGLTGQARSDVAVIMAAIESADTPQEKARLIDELGQQHPTAVAVLRDDAIEVGVRREADMQQADIASDLAEGTTNEIIAASTTGNTVRDNAVAMNINDEATWSEARTAQGFAESELDELASWRTGEGIDLSSEFGANALGVEFASAETLPQEPRTLSSASPVPGQG